MDTDTREMVYDLREMTADMRETVRNGIATRNCYIRVLAVPYDEDPKINNCNNAYFFT